MNIKNNELLIQLNNINKSLALELELSAKYYKEYKDESFEVEDHYFKFLLFSIYRSIEDLIRLLIEDRKLNSSSKEFYKLICDNNIKSFFIKTELFKIIMNEMDNNVTYIEIYNYIKNSELAKSTISILNINEIKPSRSSKDDIINLDHFFQVYKDCSNNRNTLMHSITLNLDLSKDSIKYSFFIYSFLTLLLKNRFKK